MNIDRFAISENQNIFSKGAGQTFRLICPSGGFVESVQQIGLFALACSSKKSCA
jgi:hypothetical protein